jgi:Flp pilus assembly protein TadB
MTLKQRAAVNVAKFLLAVIAIGITVNALMFYFGVATVGIIAGLSLLIYMIRFMYQVEVDKLERTNTLTKIRDSK